MSGTTIPMGGVAPDVVGQIGKWNTANLTAAQIPETQARTGLFSAQTQAADIQNQLSSARLPFLMNAYGQGGTPAGGAAPGGAPGAIGASGEQNWTGPNGVIPAPGTPFAAVGAMPKSTYTEAMVSPYDKWTDVAANLLTQKNRYVNQAIAATIDPSTGQADPTKWNQMVQDEVQSGWMDAVNARKLYGHPELAQTLLNSTLPAGEQPGTKQAQAAGTAAGTATQELTKINVPVLDANGQPTGQTQEQYFRKSDLTAGGQPRPGAQSQAAPAAVDTSLPRGVRNNNPLNLTGSGDAGADSGAGYSFGKYSSLEAGVTANAHQLLTDYNTHGLTTLQQLIGDQTHGWSPDGAPGNPNGQAARYAGQVAKALGIKPTDDIGQIISQPGGMNRLVMAMSGVENGGYVIDPGAVQRGVQAAYASPRAGGGSAPIVPAGTGPPASVAAPAGGGAAAPGAAGPTPLGAAGPPTITPLATEQLKMQQPRIAADTKTIEDTQSKVQNLQNGQSQLLNIRALSGKIDAGALGDQRAALNNYFASFGPGWAEKAATLIPGLDPSKAASQQEFVKQTLQQAGNAERDTLGSRGGFQAISLYQRAFPNINMQPTAIRDMSNLLLVAHQRDLDYANGQIGQFNNEYQQAQANPTTHAYQPLSTYDEKTWGVNDPTSVHAAPVYVAAAALLNGHPPGDAFQGLSPAQQVEALHIIHRTDPTASVGGFRPPPAQ